MTKKAVILISGGLDSATCLAIALSKGYECYCLTFDYGQKQSAELKAAAKVAKSLGAKQHTYFKLALDQFGGSALTDETLTVPDFSDSTEIPSTYVPARNTIFLSVALGYAEIIDANAIFIGVSSVDYSHYPDCRPEYIDQFQKMANLATKKGIEGETVTIHAPIINMSKAETILLGLSLGVDYSKTITCYRAGENGLACGECSSCVLRKRGFEQAGCSDPLTMTQ